MLQFVCDYCEDVKEAPETWINGLAAENVGTLAARREVVIDPTWHRERAVLPLAVHFCSIDCKDGYLAELFDKPASLEIRSAERRTVSGTRVTRSGKKPVTGIVRKRTISRNRRPG